MAVAPTGTGSAAGDTASEADESRLGVSDGEASSPATASDAEAGERATPTYEDAPVRATAEDVPGFGPVGTLIALLLAGKIAGFRRVSGS
ncbi:PGF-CTERM sorting domain-containing protein [Halorubrum sp. SD626R]|nr:PGF-CTERM sorting domain-containing protein [Halorubrum sp. SD626R]